MWRRSPRSETAARPIWSRHFVLIVAMNEVIAGVWRLAVI
jgi:hypothetical protein